MTQNENGLNLGDYLENLHSNSTPPKNEDEGKKRKATTNFSGAQQVFSTGYGYIQEQQNS